MADKCRIIQSLYYLRRYMIDYEPLKQWLTNKIPLHQCYTFDNSGKIIVPVSNAHHQRYIYCDKAE